jgi:hypothetical protein
VITDFALGLLTAAVISLALFAALVITFAAWLVGFVSKYAEIQLRKDPKGRVIVSAEVRAR